MLEVINVTKTVKQANEPLHILRGVSFSAAPGERVAIIGSSGSGKSTLLHIIGALDSPSSGCVRYDGYQPSEKEMHIFRNQHIGFVFQNFYLLEDETLLTNVLMPAFIHGQPVHKKSSFYARGIDLLTQVGLGHKLHSRCRILSGGEKQRVALVRALINQPKILLADEPTGNLDTKTANQIHDLLFSHITSTLSVVLVTHNGKLAEQCDHCYALEDGVLNQLQ